MLKLDLTALAYGPQSVGRAEQLFSDLRKMTLKRDEGAPIKVPKEKIDEFSERNDIKGFRAKILATNVRSEKQREWSKIHHTIETCTKLQLELDRQAYFKAADDMRLRGIEPEPSPGAGGPGHAALLVPFFERPEPIDEGSDTRVYSRASAKYIDAMVQFLSPRPRCASPEASENVSASSSKKRSLCHVCYKDFVSCVPLTRHFRGKHLSDGTFNKPHTCRTCLAAGKRVTVHNPAQWCNHLEHTHGKSDTPTIKPGIDSRDCLPTSAPSCLLCQTPMASMSALFNHMNQVEIPRYRGGQRFPCRACPRVGDMDGKPLSIWEWLAHALADHGWSIPRVEPCLICGHLCAPGPGFHRHFSTRHSDSLGKPLECAACKASAVKKGESRQFEGIQQLLAHAAEEHPTRQPTVETVLGKRKRDENLCGGDGGPFTAVQETSKQAHRTIEPTEGNNLGTAGVRTGLLDIPVDPALEGLVSCANGDDLGLWGHTNKHASMVDACNGAASPSQPKEAAIPSVLGPASSVDESNACPIATIDVAAPLVLAQEDCMISVPDSEEATPTSEEGVQFWNVERLIKRRKLHGKWQYKTRWENYLGPATWEPIETLLQDVPDIVEEFERNSPTMLKWIRRYQEKLDHDV